VLLEAQVPIHNRTKTITKWV